MRDEVARISILIADERARDLPPDGVPLFVQVALLELAVFHLPGNGLLDVKRASIHIIRVCDAVHGHGFQHRLRVSQHVAHLRIDSQQSPVQVHQADADVGIVEGQAEAFLAFAQRVQRLFTFGDIVRQHHARGSAVVLNGVGGDLHINERAVLFAVPPAGGFLDGLGGLGKIRRQGGNILRRADVFEGHAEEFLAAIAIMVHGGIVDH